MVEVIGSNLVRLQRIAKAESETIKEALSPVVHTETSIHEQFVGPAYKEYESSINSETAEKLLLLSRYQTATENRIYRAIAMFKNLKHEQG